MAKKPTLHAPIHPQIARAVCGSHSKNVTFGGNVTCQDCVTKVLAGDVQRPIVLDLLNPKDLGRGLI